MARGRQTLTQRIALTGGEEVEGRLKQIGQRGERAFGQLGRSARETSTQSDRLGSRVQALGGRFDALRQRTTAARRELVLLARAEPGLRRLSATVRRFASIFAAAFAVRNLSRMTTEWSFLQDRIAAVTDETISVTDAMDRLVRISNQVGEDVQEISRNYADQATILKDLNLTTREQLDLTEAITLALGLSGLHGQEATEAQNQLARAMVRGNLESRQLRRVLERGSRVVELLSEELNVGANAIREMGEAGEITSKVLTRVFLGNLDQLREEAAGSAITIGDAFTVMQNNLLHFIGSTDQATGAAGLLAGVLLRIANNLDIVIPAIALFAAAWASVQLVTLVSQLVAAARALALLAAGITASTAPLTLLVLTITLLIGAVAHFTGLLDPLYERLGLLKERSEEGREGLAELGASFDEGGASADSMGERVDASLTGVASAADRAGTETTDAMAASASSSQSLWQQATDAIGGLLSGLGDRATDILSSVLSMLRSVISMARRAAAAVASALGGGEGRRDGGAIGMREGGPVRGPGTSTSDSIFAGPRYWLSNGEYIIPARSVRQYGLAFMDQLRRGTLALDRMKGFAAGGLVDGLQAPSIPMPSFGSPNSGGSTSSGRPLSLTIGAETFDGLIAPEEVAERLVRFATTKSVRALSPRPRWSSR